MKIECIKTNFSSNCYVIYNNDSAYIVDPSCDTKVIDKYVSEEYKVKGILLTHTHIDHIYFLEEVVRKYNCKVYLSKYGLEFLKDSFKNCSELFGLNKVFNICDEDLIMVNDNDVIDGFIKVIYTPGHTSDSLCFMLDGYLFTGDTLFNMSIGRTDLYSGNYAKIVESIKKIYSFKKDFMILPGHGENSSLSEELDCNFYVKKAVK